ncbi:beclin 1-associated autophagy-related key regulator isoform X3 [Petromyzon marinus]|uniref:Beclin 1-associated autophagy-related key regulator isoform X3 n=1 Tax=Petromyzon marinus TaxID=7757 RepID=A0AAJ7SPZ2_PETMA|nr:beclin 1-associated autophagy-related key regulator isoform X3 [Petromyzon marinus]
MATGGARGAGGEGGGGGARFAQRPPRPPAPHGPPLAISVAVERCPLCSSSRRRLTCAACVHKGDFSYMDGKGDESYFKKQGKLNIAKKEKQQYQEKVREVAEAQRQKEKLKWEILCCKSRIDLLKRAIDQVKKDTLIDNAHVQRQRDENVRNALRARKHAEKEETMRRRLGRRRDWLEPRLRELIERLKALGTARRMHVRELTSSIFPLTEALPPQGRPHAGTSTEAAMQSSTVDKLAEARRTNYQSGRWVYTEGNGEVRVAVVQPHICLPHNGDFSPYYSWVEARRNSTQEPVLEQGSPAYPITAALCHTAQLVSVLSHILGINLPQRLCYSEFCREDISRHRFIRAVQKLNTNVLHLCCSQHVDPELLHPLRPLKNLMYMVRPDNSSLGRSGPFEVTADMEDSMELVDASTASQSEGSDGEDTTDEETDLGLDWETVPNPRFMDIPSRALEGSPSQSTALTNTGGTSLQDSGPISASNAGGLVSSAVASMASIWRAYTGTH